MNKSVFGHWFPLLHVDYVKLGPKWNYSGVISPYYRIYYIDQGHGTISGTSGTLVLEPGYLYLIPSFTLCNLKCEESLGQYFIQFFEESANGISLFQGHREPMKIRAGEMDEAVFKRVWKINPGRGINRSDNPKVYEKTIYYKEYQELNKLQTIAVQMETHAIVQLLLSRFLVALSLERYGQKSIPSTVMEAVNYIQVNLGDQLSVTDLAQRAHQHPDYFSRLFLEHIGQRPNAFINEKRIERAQYLIATTDMSLDQVAAEVGFETTPYFSRVFRKVTGLTPGKYVIGSKQGDRV